MSSPTNPLSQSQAWNNVAENYAEMAEWVMSPFAKKAIELTMPEQTASIIDCGCGTGLLSTLLSSKVNSILALDFSEDMLKELKNKIVARDISNIDCCQGDGQNLTFQNNSFDYAFSLFGLMFFPDRIKGFSELHRVLKPNGIALVTSWAPIEKSTLMQATTEAIKSALPDAPSPRANSSTLENPELFKSEMESAGFHQVEIKEIKIDLPDITPALFWKLMSDGGAPIALLRMKYSPNEWLNINHKILHNLQMKYEDRLMSLSTTAYFGIGRKK